MKVYMFGAGASLGSQPPDLQPGYLRSPLVDNLFDEQYSRFAAAVYVSDRRIAELKKLVNGESLEEWLTKEWTRLGEPHGKEALAMGRKLFGDLAIYTWWLMTNISTTYSEDNGYHLFLHRLADIDDKEEKAFVNFNYDLLLDKAFNKVYGYDLSSQLDHYTTHNYLKPHGSVMETWSRWAPNARPIIKTIKPAR